MSPTALSPHPARPLPVAGTTAPQVPFPGPEYTAFGQVDSRTGLPAYPSGWFAVAMSREVRAGEVIERRFMGRTVAVCRSGSGRIAVFDARCPHLGANLAAGGTMVGETVQCPFHKFRFDLDGGCVEAYGAGRLCSGRLGVHRAEEVNGIIFALHDTIGTGVAWRIPSFDSDGWTPPSFRRWHLRSHPQEVHENAPDVGHLRRLHGFEIEGFEAVAEGERFLTTYVSRKPGGFIRKGSPTASLELGIDGFMVGLGFAVTNVVLTKFGVRTRIYTLTTPTDPGELDLTIAMTMSTRGQGEIGRVSGALPQRAVITIARALVAVLLAASAREVDKDTGIWETKDYLPAPRLAVGDGPILQYRRWASQFYSSFDGGAA